MAIDYIKTGEDNKYDYYRNDSEVFSSEDNTDLYTKVLQERKEFYVKFNQEEKKHEQLEIKKKTLDRIMILSECEPEEQVLFSLHKVVDKERARTYSLSDPSKGTNNDVKLRGHKTKLNKHKKEEKPEVPPNEKATVLEVNNNPTENNQVFYNNNVENVNKNNVAQNNKPDEDVAFGQANALSGVITVSLSPVAVITKWFYLLISACGVAELIYFIYACINESIKISAYLYYLLGIGVLLILFGVFGFIQINSKNYENFCLIIICIICAVLGVVSLIFSRFEEQDIVKDNWVITILVSLIIVAFSALCAFLTNKLKKEHLSTKNTQLEGLLDDNK